MHVIVPESLRSSPGAARGDPSSAPRHRAPVSITWVWPSLSVMVMRKSLTWLTRPEIMTPSAVFTVRRNGEE